MADEVSDACILSVLQIFGERDILSWGNTNIYIFYCIISILSNIPYILIDTEFDYGKGLYWGEINGR